ncbi:hypothetical protein Q648_00208 [Bartonella quintana JK 12]|uniref:Uncharacterized protein n=1 Tax=Bartonella quintana JK 68 TaxID=1134503 RepID=A0ABR4SQX1_BARQI|nr:hypothetical protein Q651_00295 [Bartonella quintana BQ2-D70]ETS17692.1 hypothetical protein Q647_00619 [Bartonella quintana JK 7]ETS18521.1 hypothetical protein Q648_00208 [Bartonella quintana JK 12]KEC59297.1 hypothetical protein O93_00628 [Bartonella quintana JK 19]KEC62597.1 hypothetical protein O7Y_00634 [Bartonella quintana JK 63]KEC63545.1 hypothetical protein O91_00280 [Bartonella quintana JK 31]KEC64111.1 hypothetical protein O7W_01249 [Bartonella quintana JK 56]KEC66098.1 hypoth
MKKTERKQVYFFMRIKILLRSFDIEEKRDSFFIF